MRVVVVFETLFGTTRDVAESIAAGVTDGLPGAQVDVLRVGEAVPERVALADLLIVGGPTHNGGPTTILSRTARVAAEERKEPGDRHGLEPGAEGAGIRDWFHGLPQTDGERHAAAFDTRVDIPLAGGAGPGIALRLRFRGYEVVERPEGFFVEGNGGPLRDGERQRARSWGEGLARMVADRVASSTGHVATIRPGEVTHAAALATSGPSMQVLTEDVCYELLGTQEIGRLGVNAEDYPLVYPVNFGLDGTTIIIRSEPGTKLDAAEQAHVTFEVDEIDRRTRSGWSVLVRGVAEELKPGHGADVVLRTIAYGVDPWAPGAYGIWLRLRPQAISGRRILPGELPPPIDPRAYL